jgi:AcrR family transcriptional regulator
MTTSAEVTRARLRVAALQVVREQGLAAASARTIAAAAGVNQALIFYHFGTVTELIEAASADAVTTSVARYQGDFAAVRTLPELLSVGRAIHKREHREGNVAVMAQLMAGGQHDPVLARATRHALSLWIEQIQQVLDRVLAGTPVATVLDSAGLAHAVSAGFVGVELYDGVDPDGAASAFATLEHLAALVTTVNDLGPVAQAALRRTTRRARTRAARRPS